MGIIDTLRGIELISARAKATYSDFILAGPLNLWFKNIIRNPESRYIIITSRGSGERLREYLCVNAKTLTWGNEWRKVRGKLARCSLYNRYLIELLADPALRDDLPEYHARNLAKISDNILIGNYLVKLAPLSFERTLQETLRPYKTEN
ncbi:MAG: hypothetical protein F7B60_00170 [Desulfurococcales archaeon]|nr:hypothetical protein [Desulfurococcales archaeon]